MLAAYSVLVAWRIVRQPAAVTVKTYD